VVQINYCPAVQPCNATHDFCLEDAGPTPCPARDLYVIPFVPRATTVSFEGDTECDVCALTVQRHIEGQDDSDKNWPQVSGSPFTVTVLATPRSRSASRSRRTSASATTASPTGATTAARTASHPSSTAASSRCRRRSLNHRASCTRPAIHPGPEDRRLARRDSFRALTRLVEPTDSYMRAGAAQSFSSARRRERALTESFRPPTRSSGQSRAKGLTQADPS
jgi:hypothetical protein